MSRKPKKPYFVTFGSRWRQARTIHRNANGEASCVTFARRDNESVNSPYGEESDSIPRNELIHFCKKCFSESDIKEMV